MYRGLRKGATGQESVRHVTLPGMIDLHTHILPGVDDGAPDTDESIRMARAAADEGVRTIVCTSHRRKSFPTPAQRVHDGIAELQPLINEQAIPVTLLPGLEIALDQIEGMDDSELSLATLGSGRWLLLEMPPKGWPLDLLEIMTALEIRGFRVVLAHPERNESVQVSPGRLREVVGRGALVQVTSLSITGALGTAAQRSAIGLIRSGLAHVIASDMHNTWGRVPGVLRGLTAAAAAARSTVTDLAWMVRDVPFESIRRDSFPSEISTSPSCMYKSSCVYFNRGLVSEAR